MKTIVVAVMFVAAAAAMAPPAAGQASKPSTSAPAGLDTLLAPIALYPDSLIAQMLLCAATPAKMTELKTWLGANAALKGTELQDAATVAGFEPSFVALALFPQVVSYMADRLDWTRQLGTAFSANRSAVFDSIQRLRKQAQASGALKTTPQQVVESTTTPSGQQVIVIEPANPQIIYVPQYDPQIVYVQSPSTTTVVVEDDDSDAIVAGVIGFTAGIALGAAIDNDYYYGPWGFHGGVHMYNDAWDDWADHREDAREDWTDHREDLVEERGDRAREGQQQRTERTDTRQDGRTDRTGERTSTAGERTARQTTGTAGTAAAREPTATQSSRGYGGTSTRATPDRSGTKSDAFSGYGSGGSERAASSRGQQSRGSQGGGSRGGGGGRRR